MLTIRGVSEPLATLLDGRDPGGVADRWFIDNGLTNLTLFRHYLMHYLAERPDIIKEMYIVARTLKPSPSGIRWRFTASPPQRYGKTTKTPSRRYLSTLPRWPDSFPCASISIPPGTISGVSPRARRPDGPAAVGRRLNADLLAPEGDLLLQPGDEPGDFRPVLRLRGDG